MFKLIKQASLLNELNLLNNTKMKDFKVSFYESQRFSKFSFFEVLFEGIKLIDALTCSECEILRIYIEEELILPEEMKKNFSLNFVQFKESVDQLKILEDVIGKFVHFSTCHSEMFDSLKSFTDYVDIGQKVKSVWIQKMLQISTFGDLIDTFPSLNSNSVDRESEKMFLQMISEKIKSGEQIGSENNISNEIRMAKERTKELSSELEKEKAEKMTIVENYESQIKALSEQLLFLLENQNK